MPKRLSRCTAVTGVRGAHGGRVRGAHSRDGTFRSQPRASSGSIQLTSARSLMDRASDYGSEGWKFESSRARRYPLR